MHDKLSRVRDPHTHIPHPPPPTATPLHQEKVILTLRLPFPHHPSLVHVSCACEERGCQAFSKWHPCVFALRCSRWLCLAKQNTPSHSHPIPSPYHRPRTPRSLALFPRQPSPSDPARGVPFPHPQYPTPPHAQPHVPCLGEPLGPLLFPSRVCTKINKMRTHTHTHNATQKKPQRQKQK